MVTNWPRPSSTWHMVNNLNHAGPSLPVPSFWLPHLTVHGRYVLDGRTDSWLVQKGSRNSVSTRQGPLLNVLDGDSVSTEIQMFKGHFTLSNVHSNHNINVEPRRIVLTFTACGSIGPQFSNDSGDKSSSHGKLTGSRQPKCHPVASGFWVARGTTI